MLSQVGSVTTNGIQQKSDYRDSTFTGFADMPVWPNLLAPSAVPAGTFPSFTGVKVFDRDYQNPRISQLQCRIRARAGPQCRGVRRSDRREKRALDALLELQRPRHGAGATQPATRDATTYVGANPFGPQLGDVFVTNSLGHGLYRGATFGVRKRLSQSYQFEANYVLSKDEDDDSNERDPFTDRSFNFYDLSLDYGPSDRDIRHKFNFFTFAELPGKIMANVRMQGRTAQPITTSPRVLNGDRSRPQLGPEGQRVLLARLAVAAGVPSGDRLSGHSERRNVQYVQQRQ